MAAAHRAWAARLEPQGEARTVGELLDQYLLQVVPDKAPKTQESNRISARRLRAVFAAVPLTQVEPVHGYRYVELARQKHGLTSARRDFEVLRHAFTKAVEWGLVRSRWGKAGFPVAWQRLD